MGPMRFGLTNALLVVALIALLVILGLVVTKQGPWTDPCADPPGMQPFHTFIQEDC
jgi:hypothetical protein